MLSYIEILQAIDSNTFICSMCGKKIYPVITDVDLEKETMSTVTSNNQIRGGLGNGVLKNNICDQCVSKSVEFAENMTRLKMGRLYPFK